LDGDNSSLILSSSSSYLRLELPSQLTNNHRRWDIFGLDYGEAGVHRG